MHCGYTLLTYCITRSAVLHPIEMSWYFEPGFRGYTRLCWVGEKARFLIFLYTSYTFCASGQIPGHLISTGCKSACKYERGTWCKERRPSAWVQGGAHRVAGPRFRSLSLCALRPTVEQALLEHSSDPQINQYTMAATMVKSARNPQQKPPLLLPAHGCSRHLVSLDGSVIGHEACLCAVAPADCDCAPAGGLPARQS